MRRARLSRRRIALTDPVLIPAATLILIRERADGAPFDVLMIERTATMAFAAGAMVFPGGRIDPGDHDVAAALGTDADLPARVAAIRETIEEVGIAAGLSPPPGPAVTARLRAGLAGGIPFANLLATESLRIVPDLLTPFARWSPGTRETRAFDTLFFLARAPADAVARPDRTEAADAVWTSPAGLLAEADAGRRRLIFPTRRNLERLGGFADHAAAVAQARAIPPVRITPWMEDRPDGRWRCIPDGLGYPVTAERLD
jgi:8-oxo-dGTP pyrophosphatase MutT (NUDIX family)